MSRSGGIIPFLGWTRPAAPPADVDQERATIARETERERQILRAHIARPEAEARFEKWLMDAAAAGPRVNVGTLTVAEVPLEFRKVLRWEKRALITHDPELAFTAALASIVPDALRADADAGFTQFYAAHGEGLSDAERRSQLQECRAARLAAELAEERAIRAEEAASGGIDRRDDADPAVVLAFDADLVGTTRPTTIDVSRLHALEAATAAMAAARHDAQERHRDAETDFRRAVSRRDAEHASRTPVSRAIREETLAEHEAAVGEHEAIVARYAAPLEAIASRWETLSRLARACRELATKQGIDRPRQFEPGVTAA